MYDTFNHFEATNLVETAYRMQLLDELSKRHSMGSNAFFAKMRAAVSRVVKGIRNRFALGNAAPSLPAGPVEA